MGFLKNILITGATGFLGSHLLRSLVEHGYQPVVYLRSVSDTSRINDLQGKFVAVHSSDKSFSEFKDILSQYRIDCVIHTATNYGRSQLLSDIIESNVLFPLRLAEASLKHQVKLFINTDTFFGKSQFDLKYLNNYTTSKRMFGVALKELAGNLNIANMRLEHIYGEYDSEQKFITDVLIKLISNVNEIELTEGFQKRDFVYIKDVVNAYLVVLKNYGQIIGFKEFEVGTGQSIPVKDLVKKMAHAAASKSHLNFGAFPARQGEIQDSFADTSALRKMGWQPEYDLETALNRIFITEKKRYVNEL
jgi:nucleoside-diphosphate-sugar epimerase